MSAFDHEADHEFDHEEVLIRRGTRSGLPVIVAVHSTALGPAIGGCRVWRYADWAAAVGDALRLSAAMTRKAAMAGLANGGGKTVVAVPANGAGETGGAHVTDPARRRDLLHDIGDVIASLDGRYATGPDVGTTAADMAVIGERTTNVFCRPARFGGSGDPSPHTAAGALAAIQAVCARRFGTTELAGRRLAVVGLGNVGGNLAGMLAAAGAELLVADIDPAKRALAGELGAAWTGPDEAITAAVDVLVPAALGGILTEDVVPALRCAAVVGPANNQLAAPAVAELLRRRGITWVPDYIVSGGGIIGTLSMELHGRTPDEARARVRGIGDTVHELLDAAERAGITPARAAHELAGRRLAAVPIAS